MIYFVLNKVLFRNTIGLSSQPFNDIMNKTFIVIYCVESTISNVLSRFNSRNKCISENIIVPTAKCGQFVSDFKKPLMGFNFVRSHVVDIILTDYPELKWEPRRQEDFF